MTNEQREEASIYVYVIRKALGEEVGMGDVKHMKHYPCNIAVFSN